jgi:hypothetical protein
MNRHWFDEYCAKPENWVAIKKPRFIQEHTNLIKVLEKKDPKELDAEKKDQKEELELELKSGKKLKKGGATPAEKKQNWIADVTESPTFKKGDFTKKAEEAGMTTKAFMKKVLARPDEYDLHTRRQAQFMANATQRNK